MIRILLALKREGSHTQQSVLTLQHYIHPMRNVISYQRRYPNPKVHIKSVLQFLRYTPCYLFFIKCHLK